jgi:hypothetical protein
MNALLDLHLHELQLLQRSANPCNSSTYFMFDPDQEEKHEKTRENMIQKLHEIYMS